MSYNNDGGCCNGGGWSMPFVMPFPGTQGNGNGWGNGSDMMGWMMMFLFFSLFGFGGYGGGFGGRGVMPGMMGGCAGGNIAADAAAYVGAQNTADRVSGIATGVDAIAGIATANGVKLETVKDQSNAAFANLNTHLCEAFNNVAQQFNAQTQQGMNLHNSLVALLNDMRAEQAKCCCETKYRAEADKCEILREVAAAEGRLAARMDAAEKTALLEKINLLQEQKAGLKTQLENNANTAQILAAIQAQCGQPRGCAPAPACGPCGPYPYTPYYNGCCGEDLFQRVVNRAAAGRLEDVLFPAAAPTTAAAAAG